MAAAVAPGPVPSNRIEDQIRITANTKGIRPSEFFQDYDMLRSGYVTETQFFRVLWENLGVKLNDEQQKELALKYNFKGDGRMNYRKFCNVVNRPFNPKDLSAPPSEQGAHTLEFLGTERSVRPLSPNSETKLKQMLQNLLRYYKYHGINLRTSCEDFDTHHIGVIQESQFYRSFPRPPEVTEREVDLLVKKYRDPDRPGLINYLNMHHDLEALGQQLLQEEATEWNQVTNISKFLPCQNGADGTLQNILDKMQVAVYKNGVRTIEFFRDYDQLRSGLITENQFLAGLSLALAKEAQLGRHEMQKVVEFYRTPDGRVRYKDFCDTMENAFNIPHLEKKPTLQVVRPPRGALGRNLTVLSEEEEGRVMQVIAQLSDQAQKRRLMMYQYFKDYDRSMGYTRVITLPQLGRILHFLDLTVSPEDLKLLGRKFADSTTGDVNYPAFVQAVDREFVNYIQDDTADEGCDAPLAVTGDGQTPVNLSVTSFDDLMALIRHHVLVNRRRVCEFFQDFDQLRSGSITKSQFKRGLSDLGLSALGQIRLTEGHFLTLCSHYENPDMRDRILWTRFMADVESVFTQPNLEKMPNYQVPSQDIFRVPKPGTIDWSCAPQDLSRQVDNIMKRLRECASQRRISAKPVFQDFDRHNKGHVTRSQFRQCLTMLELHCAEAEMQALEAKFCNDTGFGYMPFLQELQPQDPPKAMYQERLAELRLTNQKSKLPEGTETARHLEEILQKIRAKVYRERVRVLEWMKDYDKLRSGRLSRERFRRALDLCRFELKESELALLEDHYQSPYHSNSVSYVDFSDDVESVFTTKNLEKTPLIQAQQLQPVQEWEQNRPSPETEGVLLRCMERLADKVRKNRIQLFPLFEDYDRVHNGSVSRSQFRRVLSELELAWLVPTEQEWLCLFDKFSVTIGGRNDVNYIAFCDMTYALAQFEWRKP